MSGENQSTDLKTYWDEKLKSKEVRIGVIGLGYVGLPLAVEFAKEGFYVTGFDLDTKKIDTINRGVTYIKDVKDDDIKETVDSGNLTAKNDFSHLQKMDAVSICVPTPLRKTKDPDISYVVAAVDSVEKYMHRGQLVVLESTTYPGTTEELLLPRLEGKGFKVGEDFFLAFSPERVNPGDAVYLTRNTPKVIGGMTSHCSAIAKNLYEKVIDTVIPVSSPRVAEMVKLLENTFRSVNIGMVNELALMCDKLEIDVWEVIDAAATKPFGFMPFYPGPGLGGHCIPIDPFYLSWKAKTVGFEARFIELAGQVNSSMPYYVFSKIINALNEFEKSVKGSKIIIIGVTYKKDVDDIRESPALDIIGFLERKGAHVDYFDPHVPQFEHGDKVYKSVNNSNLNDYDCAVIVTDHSKFDLDSFFNKFPLIVDTRNAFKNYNSPKIVKL